MNQSNKKNLEFIVNSGVNYFLQDSPRNWFENEKKLNKAPKRKPTKTTINHKRVSGSIFISNNKKNGGDKLDLPISFRIRTS